MKRIILFLIATLTLLLLNAACQKTQPRPPFLPTPEITPPPEMKWEVRTDYTNLTPYIPPHTSYSRLKPGSMPELIPDDYGMLLPYSSPGILNDGSMRASQYGLVTIDGMIVTDLVYDRVERAYGYYMGVHTSRPAYRITINDTGGESMFYFDNRQGACALDGSWITSLDYLEVAFSEDLILLIRDYNTNDIDVYDYNGTLLYNTLELDWIKNISRDYWIGNLTYNLSEGYSTVQMKDGTYAFINMLNGRARYTEFTQADTFYEGMALVAVKDKDDWRSAERYGFIDSSFELVIPATYTSGSRFQNGYAVVENPNGSMKIINKRGETKLTVQDGHYLDQTYDGTGFSVRSRDAWDLITLYTTDLVEFKPPAVLQDTSLSNQCYSIGGGWYVCAVYEADSIVKPSGGRIDVVPGTYLFSPGREYFFPGISHLSYADDEFMIFVEYDGVGYKTGVMRLDGGVIIPAEKDATITAVAEDGNAIAFIITHSPGLSPRAARSSNTYRLVDTNGNTITSGSGLMEYDEAAGLFSILGQDFFTWMDKSGNAFISIPLMSYTMD